MRYYVTGRIHPERADVSFSTVVWEIEGGGVMEVSCDSSQLTVLLRDVPSVDGYVTAFVMAKGMAATVTAAVGFVSGSGYSVEMIQVLEDAAGSRIIGVRPDNLPFESDPEMLTHTVRLATGDVYFRHAIQDYVRAIATEIDCAFLCYRAIEGIKSAFDASDPGHGWDAMHAALATRKADIETLVKAFADPVRHGNWAAMPDTSSAQRNAMLTLTKGILAAYLASRMPTV